MIVQCRYCGKEMPEFGEYDEECKKADLHFAHNECSEKENAHVKQDAFFGKVRKIEK